MPSSLIQQLETRSVSLPKLSIIIPAYREEKNIYKTLLAIVEAQNKQAYSYEIIVVVDGSPDTTEKEAKRVNSPHLKVFSYQPNHGKGYALKYGAKHAIGEIITFADAGGDFDPIQFDRCVQLMELFDADLVIGSKWHPASKVSYPPLRKIYSRSYHTFVKVLLGLRVTDTQTGLKFIRANVANAILPRVLVKQYAFDVELLVVAKQLGFTRVFEAPVDLQFNDVVSGINAKAIRNMIVDTLAIFYRARIKNYYRKSAITDLTYPKE